jgi:hypothetical protein
MDRILLQLVRKRWVVPPLNPPPGVRKGGREGGRKGETEGGGALEGRAVESMG